MSKHGQPRRKPPSDGAPPGYFLINPRPTPAPAPPQRLYPKGFGGLHALVLIVTIAAAVIAIFFAGFCAGAVLHV